jgi:aminoglycoside phosphotransferase (APT) family kinase protein
MFELNALNAPDYLAERGIRADSAVELGGGVSNVVVLCETSAGRLILKQSAGRLRVQDEWLSDRARIFREAEAMRHLAPLLGSAVPEILFEDRPSYVFAMSAAPLEAISWKQRLMSGDANEDDARRAAGILELLIAKTREVEGFGDQTVFNELRIDPYYRTTAARHPDLREHFDALIRCSAARRICLVHGDFSPKNLLVWGGQMMIIDFEVVHYGDPSFDAAFLLNHLLIKSHVCPGPVRECARAFWRSLSTGLAWFEEATIAHLGCLLLARVDGKSPVEYVRDEAMKQRLRGLAREIITAPPQRVEDLFA